MYGTPIFILYIIYSLTYLVISILLDIVVNVGLRLLVYQYAYMHYSEREYCVGFLATYLIDLQCVNL